MFLTVSSLTLLLKSCGGFAQLILKTGTIYVPMYLVEKGTEKMPANSEMIWCITLSPEGNIPDEWVEKFMEFISKHGQMWRVITEETDTIKRHVHSIVMFKDAKRKDWLKDALMKKLRMTAAEKTAFKNVRKKFGRKVEAVHTAYDGSFYEKYLHKSDQTVVVIDDNWVPEKAEPYYVEPSKAPEGPNPKFYELKEFYGGQKNLLHWYYDLMEDDKISWNFIPPSQVDFFLRRFAGWYAKQEKVASRGEEAESDQGVSDSD